MSEQPATGVEAVFHSIPGDPACPYCTGEKARPDWSFVDGVWCISLQDREDRARLAAGEFHRLGLCGRVEFYRPGRPGAGVPPREAIWRSHKAVMRKALESSCARALIFEDDVKFSSIGPVETRLRRAIDRLPEGWNGLFLGHWPISGWFTGWGVMKVRSGLAHAFIANRPLLQLIDSHDVLDPRLKYTSLFGKGIDSALGSLDHMYALFPMAALQRDIASDNLSATVTRSGLPRRWNDKLRYRVWLIQKMPRAGEVFCALLSPLHWLRTRIRPPR